MQGLLLTISSILCVGGIAMANRNPKVEFIDTEKNESVAEVLVGRALTIKVTELPPDTAVTLTCDNLLSQSSAIFRSNYEGMIDLSKQGPLYGSYSGVDIDGMFWSRTMNSDNSPDAKPGPFVCRAFIENKEVASRAVRKIYQLPQVTSTRITKTESGFEALFSTPSGPGPFPALFLVSGSEGGLDEFSANYFASLGYATLSVAYYAMPGLPNELNQIPLEYFKTAIEWLKSQKNIDSKRMGLYGVSRGGELALLLASTYSEDFAAVIANEPSGVVWSSIVSGDNNQHSSWTLKGQDIPAVPYTNEIPHKEIYPDGREIVTYTNIFLAALKNDEAVKKAIIPVEKFKGPLLILAGASDQIWPSCILSDFAIQRRKQFGLNVKDIYYCFPDAGHTIGVPGAPLMDLTFYHPVAQEFWHAGGTPAGNAKAQRVGWDAVIRFLNDNLLPN